MKKAKNAISASVSMMFCIMMIFTHTANAMVKVYVYPPISSAITWDSASVITEVMDYQGGNYQMHLDYQPAGDTMHSTVQSVYSFDGVQTPITGLPANTIVTVWAIVIDGTDTVISSPISFTTKPFPHRPYISSVNVLTSPTSGLVTFRYNVSEPTLFFARYGGPLYQTDTFVVSKADSGIGSVTITNPYVIGTTYDGNILRAKSLSGIVADSTVTFGSFTVPAYSKPAITPITFSNVTQDSFTFTTSVALGNASSGVITVRDLDSNGLVVNTRPLTIINSDTVIAPTRTSDPYIMSGERVIITTSGGSDSTTAFRRTLQIESPDIVSVDTINAGSSTTDLVVIAKTNGKPTWANSNCNVWCKWRNADNVVITSASQQVSGASGSTQLTFTGLSNLYVNPNTNSVTVYIQNNAQLIDSVVYVFKLRSLLPAVPIDNGWYIDAGNAFEIRIQHVNAGPSILPYQVKALVNVMGSGQVDTFSLRANQTGNTNFLQIDTVGNRVGNTAYQVRLMTQNMDNVRSVTVSKTVTTIPAADPSYFISNSISTTQSSVNYKFMGCGNGTPSYARVQVLDKWDMQVIAQTDLGYFGTGNFSYTGSFTGLTTCTDYQLKVILHNGQFGNQFTAEKDFNTGCTTGIEDTENASVALKLFPNPVTDVLNIISKTKLGQLQIYSPTGGTVGSYYFGDRTEAQISCVELPAGFYILQGDGFTRRFVK